MLAGKPGSRGFTSNKRKPRESGAFRWRALRRLRWQETARMARKQPWKAGDVVLVPLLDGSWCPAQVLAAEPQALNSVAMAFFEQRIDDSAPAAGGKLDPAKIFSIPLVTRDLLDNGRWRVVGEEEVLVAAAQRPYETTRSRGFIGAKIKGSGLVESFLDAFYGLAAWDEMPDPAYYDGYLLRPDLKPLDRLVYRPPTSPVG
jgi:hypothetical protein